MNASRCAHVARATIVPPPRPELDLGRLATNAADALEMALETAVGAAEEVRSGVDHGHAAVLPHDRASAARYIAELGRELGGRAGSAVLRMVPAAANGYADAAMVEALRSLAREWGDERHTLVPSEDADG